MFQKPAKINRGKYYDTCMTYLLQAIRDHESAGGELLTVTEKRYACGLPLPPFQRPKKWTQERQVPLDSFINALEN